ncbi:MAG: diguanylate cyclase [Acidobacteriota bacterium]
MLAATGNASEARPRRLGLADWILGQDPIQRRAVKRLLLVSHAYAVIWLLVAVSIHAGMSRPAAWLVVAYGVVGQSVFYAILRKGLTLQMADPLLCFPQVLFGVVSVVLGYVFLPFAQGSSLQVLFVLLVYDLHRLTIRQIRIVGGVTAVLLTLAVAAMWVWRRDGLDLRQEALNIGMAMLVIPMLAGVSSAVRRVHVNQMEKRTELDKVLGELKTLSQHDALTGCVNRRYMLELLDEELKRQRRTGRGFCLAMLDVDHFKQVNDGHGHAVGDQVLQRLAHLARDTLRGADVMARWGGEEFLLMLPVTTLDEAGQIVERLRQKVAEQDWQALSPGLRVTFSAGVVAHDGPMNVERSIDLADAALYRAKQSGRNRVESA